MRLRQALEDDCLFVYDLRHCSSVMNNSFNCESFSYIGHKAYFQRKVKDKDCFFYIVVVEGERAGVVRVELAYKWYIHIALLPRFQGRGIGTEAIKAATQAARVNIRCPIYAEILENNAASIAAFKKAGYMVLNDLGKNKLMRYDKV